MITFSQDELNKLESGIESEYFEESISVTYPQQRNGGIELFNRTIRIGMTATNNINAPAEEFHKWLRLQVKNKIDYEVIKTRARGNEIYQNIKK